MNKIITIFFVEWRQIYTRIAFETTGIYLKCLWAITKHRERIQKFRETDNLKHLKQLLVLLMMQHILIVKI